MQAKDIMTREVITVTPEEKVEEVARILAEHKFSGVPVVDARGCVQGIVTESDLIVRARNLNIPFYITLFDSIIFLENPRRFHKQLEKFTAIQVQDIMTTRVLTVTSDTPVSEIASLMTDKKINRVPVVDDDQLVGIITRNDIVRCLVKQ